MKFTTNDVSDMLDAITPYIRKIIKQEVADKNTPFVCEAVVVGVPSSNPYVSGSVLTAEYVSTDVVSVRLLSSLDDSNATFSVANRTDTTLVVGDHVWLFCWYDVTNSFAIAKN